MFRAKPDEKTHKREGENAAEMFIKKKTRNAPWLILRPSSAFKVTQRDAHTLRLMSAETSWTAQAGVRDSWTKPISIGIDRSVLECKIGQKSLRQLNKEQREKETELAKACVKSIRFHSDPRLSPCLQIVWHPIRRPRETRRGGRRRTC